MHSWKPTRNVEGMISLTLGIILISMQDGIIKGLSGDYAVTQAIVIRSIVALPIFLAMVHFETGLGNLRSRNLLPMLLRGLLMLSAYTSYYMVFPVLPLAEAVALFFTCPIFITLLAGPMLGERVRPGTWVAVLLGFAGVLIILRPGGSLFEPAALLSLVTAVTYAIAMIMARKLGRTEPASVMSFYQNGVYLVGGGLVASIFASLGVTHVSHRSLNFLVRQWTMPSTGDLLLMVACGIIAAVALPLLTHAYRRAEANLVTTLEYTAMIWVPLWGFLFFGEIPRLTTILGAALIVAAGLYAVRAASADN